jgi:hypothetical protein
MLFYLQFFVGELMKNVGAIKNGQSRETGNIGYTKTQDEDKQNNNTTQKTKIYCVCTIFFQHESLVDFLGVENTF